MTASGTAPLTYQWYSGATGSTTAPVPGATATTFTTPPLSVTTSYWVRVSNPYGTADSPTVVVTVLPPVPAPTGPDAFEGQVLDLINQVRAAGTSCGGTPYPPVAPLVPNANLHTAAHDHSVDMATQNYVSHTSLDGRTFVDRIVNAGYALSGILGENIAAGQLTPQAAVDAWVASPGHCTTMMSGAFRSAGVGYASSATSTYFSYWTVDFGGS